FSRTLRFAHDTPSFYSPEAESFDSFSWGPTVDAFLDDSPLQVPPRYHYPNSITPNNTPFSSLTSTPPASMTLSRPVSSLLSSESFRCPKQTVIHFFGPVAVVDAFPSSGQKTIAEITSRPFQDVSRRTYIEPKAKEFELERDHGNVSSQRANGIRKWGARVSQTNQECVRFGSGALIQTVRDRTLSYAT
ncbi:hypothetical protein BJV77DRAFT_1000794, partial [Russula vinacea]